MRLMLTAALLLVATNTYAVSEDDYAVCLIGQTVIALHNQAPDALNPMYDSLKAAHSMCEAPKVSEAKLREVDDYVETVVEEVMVERMASE
jgi:hypothetical protein